MLMARCLIELLQTWSNGSLPQLDKELLQQMVMPTLFQCLARILRSQLIDGSWGVIGPREETAYAIITLTSLWVLPLAQFFRVEIFSAVDRGRTFLRKSEKTPGRKPEYLWIEKVTYWSKNLAEAYTIAALYTSIDKPLLGGAVRQLSGIKSQDLAEFGLRTEKGPLSKDLKWLVIASWIDGRLCVPLLQRRFENPWHREGLVRSYEGLAFRWAYANNRTGSFVSSQFVCDMISLSLLSDQITASVDEAIASQNRDRIGQLKYSLHEAVKQLCRTDNPVSLSEQNGAISKTPEEGDSQQTNDLACRDHHILQNTNVNETRKAPADLLVTPSSFVNYLESHDGLSGASESDRGTLRLEVKRFILAQISRMEDYQIQGQSSQDEHAKYSDSDASVEKSRDMTSPMSRTTSLTGLPHTFAFAICLRSQNGNDSFPTASQKHIAQQVIHGIAAAYRLQQEINASLCTSPAAGLNTREQVATILSFEKARLGVTMSHLENVGLDIDVLRTFAIVAEVADLAGKLFDLGY